MNHDPHTPLCPRTIDLSRLKNALPTRGQNLKTLEAFVMFPIVHPIGSILLACWCASQICGPGSPSPPRCLHSVTAWPWGHVPIPDSSRLAATLLSGLRSTVASSKAQFQSSLCPQQSLCSLEDKVHVIGWDIQCVWQSGTILFQPHLLQLCPTSPPPLPCLTSCFCKTTEPSSWLFFYP